MREKILSTDLEAFLADYVKSSTIEILEEGSEKKEIYAVAKLKGYDLKNNKDLAGFKTIYTFVDKANKNKARLPKAQLLKALPTLIGKPVDIDHNRKAVVGHYIDYKFHANKGMVVAYGVFYKSNFGKEWKEAKRLMKKGKLATSYEIWSPKETRRQLADGTEELREIEIAGGALLFKEEPAFEDAKVLELAKINTQSMDMIFASTKKYNEEEIVMANNPYIEEVKKNAKKLADDKAKAKEKAENKEETTQTPVEPEVKKEAPKEEEKAPEKIEEKPEVKKEEPEVKPEVKEEEKVEEPVVPKLACEHCKADFTPPELVEGEIKCQKCFAILDKAGKMLFPPQIIDFKLSCPTCQVDNWKKLENAESSSDIKCMSCAKEYRVNFKTTKPNPELDIIDFMYISETPCLQCKRSLPINGTSKADTYELTCNKCGLTFTHSIKGSKQFKQIETVCEILEKAEEKVEEKPVEKKEEPKVEVPEVKEEVKKEEPTVEVKPEEKVELPKKSSVEVTESLEVKAGDAQSKQFKEDITTASTVTLEQAKVETSKVLHKAVSKILKLKKTNRDLVVSSKKKEKVLTEGIVKVATRLISAKAKCKDYEAELKKIKREADEKVKIYLENASVIVSRRTELGEYGKSLSDKDILDKDTFITAKLQKENGIENLESTEIVGDKNCNRNASYYKDMQERVNEQAYGKIEKKEKKEGK